MIKIVKDNIGNDVLMFNSKVIPLNKKNTDNNFRQIVMNHCTGNFEYDAYQINDELYLIKQIKKYKYYTEVNYKLINDDTIELFTSIETASKSSFFAYNNKYITVVERDYDYPINDVVAAYDIDANKLINCHDYQTKQVLCDSVVNYKRCLYDVVASILTNQILMIDKGRLFSFMSFITNETIDDNNYYDYVEEVKKYIIHCYPGFKGKKVDTSKRIILDLNCIYGIGYFKFKKIPYKIDNLNYINDKQLVK